jgi:hypothetical protein
MAELEKVKANERLFKAFGSLQSSTTNCLETAYKAIKKIDEN